MLAPWPARCPDQADDDAEQEIEWLKQIIIGIRTIRSESNIPPGNELPVFVVNATSLDRSACSAMNPIWVGSQKSVASPNWRQAIKFPPAPMALCVLN